VSVYNIAETTKHKNVVRIKHLITSQKSVMYKSFTLWDHGYGASASRGVSVYVPAFAGRLRIAPTHGRMARLSWPGWLGKRHDGHPSQY